MGVVCPDENRPVYLEPIEHKYFDKETGESYTSVTQVISTIEEEFDAENIAEAISKQSEDKKKEEYHGLTKEEILDYWKEINDEANEYGTKIHEVIEDYLNNDKWYFPEDELSQKVIRAYNELGVEEGECMYPEKVLFNHDYKLAGTTDLLVDVDEQFFDIGDWKGLPVGTPILTQQGWKTMGELSKNDMVYDKDGDLVNIKHISNTQDKPCYKITFDNNETIISDHEHRWLISFRRDKKFNDFVMTTKELYDYINTLNNRWSHKIPKVKINKPLNNEKTDLPIDPYVLGVWLGDGHASDGKITNMYPEIWGEIINRGYELGEDVSNGGSGKAQTKTIKGLRKLLIENDLLSNKHIPDLYYLCSYEQRLDLLRGLMDSDGHYNKTRKRFAISTTKKGQAEYFLGILSSLGVKGTFIEYKKTADGNKIDCYDVCFSTKELNPFLCLNQDIKISSNKQNNMDFKNIVSVEKVDSVPTKCIEVDSPSSTYLYGNTFSVTHNTNKRFEFHSPYGNVLKPPFDHLQDCHYSVYSLQLSTYALMYEWETGRKCRKIWIGYWDRQKETIDYIPVFYLKNEAKKLMDHHKYNNLIFT